MRSIGGNAVGLTRSQELVPYPCPFSVLQPPKDAEYQSTKQKAPCGAKLLISKEEIWRRDPESNWAKRICNPVHNRFAIAPLTWTKKGSMVCFPLVLFGAGNEARTRDLNLGKVALYQLSYSRIRQLF